MRRPLAGLTRHNVLREALSGVTLLAISVPLNIGYAQIAGLPVAAGLYALIVPTVVYALLVSSRQVVASPDAAAAALVFSSLTGLGIAGADFATMAAAQAIICGLALLIASWLKLGFLANFLSKPILVGFVAGLALEVLLSQIAKMLGIRLESGGEFFENIAALVTRLGEASALSAVMAFAALALLLAGRRFAPKIPAALVVLIVATVVTVAFGLDERGVAVLGSVPAGPPQFDLPSLSLSQWMAIVPSALALALITMAEGVLVSRSYADRHGYRVDADRDLAAFGAANVAAGLSLSFAVGSSTSRTAAMDQLGSRTQLPSIVLALGSLLLLLFGTGLLEGIPSPVIGAVVAVAVIRLLGVAEMRQIARQSRYEAAIGGACVLGVLILGPIGGLLLAFVLSLVNLVRRAAHPEVGTLSIPADPDASLTDVTEDAQPDEAGTLVVRFAAPLFFGNGATLAGYLDDATRDSDGRIRTVVLDAEAITDVDVTGAAALRRAMDALDARGIGFSLSRLRPELRARLARFGLLDEGVGEFATTREAVQVLRERYGPPRDS